MGMSPTISDGDNLVIDRRAYEQDKAVARFDIIAFKVSSDLFHYKRVMGLPNEKVEIRGGQFFVNDTLLDEPFEQQRSNESNFGPLVIPENEYFVLGDNRGNSNDSRAFGPIMRDDIKGRVWFRYWPLTQIHTF